MNAEEQVLYSKRYPSVQQEMEQLIEGPLLSDWKSSEESLQEFWQRMEETVYHPIPGRQKQGQKFIAMAKELSEEYNIDIDIRQKEIFLFLPLCLTLCSCSCRTYNTENVISEQPVQLERSPQQILEEQAKHDMGNKQREVRQICLASLDIDQTKINSTLTSSVAWLRILFIRPTHSI